MNILDGIARGISQGRDETITVVHVVRSACRAGFHDWVEVTTKARDISDYWDQCVWCGKKKE